MAHYTIYGITKDGTYAANGGGFTDSELDEDSFAAYHYDSWNSIDWKRDEELITKLAKLLSTGHHVPTVGRDEDWWYIELDQETIDAYFKEMWEHFCEALKEVKMITAPDMKDWYQPALRNLNDVFSCDGCDMVYEMENGWMTPQEFMRYVKPGTRYYICGAVDAHY